MRILWIQWVVFCLDSLKVQLVNFNASASVLAESQGKAAVSFYKHTRIPNRKVKIEKRKKEQKMEKTGQFVCVELGNIWSFS